MNYLPYQKNTSNIASIIALLCTIFSFCPSSALADSFFETRVSQASTRHPQIKASLSQLSPNGLELWKKIADHADSHSKMPTVNELNTIFLSFDKPISQEDNLYIWFCYGMIQLYKIDTQNIIESLAIQRNVIASIDISYFVQDMMNVPVMDDSENKATRFVMDRNKIRFDQNLQNSDNGGPRKTESFDGEVLRSVEWRLGAPPNAAIMKPKSLARFYEVTNPLLCACLVDTKMETGRQDNMFDIRSMEHAFQFETTVAVENLNCVVISNSVVEYYCSPAHNFAVIQVKTPEVSYDIETGRYKISDSTITRLNWPLQEISTGVWMPLNSNYKHIDDQGNQLEAWTVNVSDVHVNATIDPDTFTDIFPEKAYVADFVQDATYQLNDNLENVEDIIKDHLTQNQRPYLRYALIVAANVVFFFLLWFCIKQKKCGKQR